MVRGEVKPAMPSRKRSGESSKKKPRRDVSAVEIEAQRATDLPNREVMTLIDPNLLGGGLVGATPTGSQVPVPPPPDGGTVQSTGGSLVDRFMPKAAEGATGQPYQPSVEQSADS